MKQAVIEAWKKEDKEEEEFLKAVEETIRENPVKEYFAKEDNVKEDDVKEHQAEEAAKKEEAVREEKTEKEKWSEMNRTSENAVFSGLLSGEAAGFYRNYPGSCSVCMEFYK